MDSEGKTSEKTKKYEEGKEEEKEIEGRRRVKKKLMNEEEKLADEAVLLKGLSLLKETILYSCSCS